MKTLREILTPRQFQIAGLVRDGLSNREIAQAVGLAYDTIKTRMVEIFDRVGCDNRAMLAVRFERENRS